jgi:serine/threonine protein kinase/class 3 adenylate cyclase
MDLARYRLLAQTGAGRDAVAYRAEILGEPAPVDLRVLTPARAEPGRWAWLTRRLRLAALLDHPSALRLAECALEHDPPYVALPWTQPWDADARPLAEIVQIMRTIAAVLTAAHRLGLPHGRLAPIGLRVDGAGALQMDFTGIECEDVAAATSLQESPATQMSLGPGVDVGTACAADVYDLGVLLRRLLTGSIPTALGALIGKMVAPDPEARPSAREVEEALAALRVYDTPDLPLTHDNDLSRTRAAPEVPAVDADRLLERGRLGRFRLLAKVGEGGMGAVYRAEDPADGAVVAIKVLRADLARHPAALRRFHKEARLLAEANNPYVTNLREVNEDAGVPYLVLEFVAGPTLAHRLAAGNPLDEPEALAILADTARALADAHRRGIVHRDIKPGNILLLEAGAAGAADGAPRLKLSDFGLARHVLESESLNLTQPGAVLGTPYYMAPEQCAGGAVDARADVYALGATLFHMLAGRPPFIANDPLSVATMHRNDPVPVLQKLNAAVSDGACRLVERLLAKAPDARPADAGAVLRELERLLRGELADITLHPRLPACDPQRVLRYEWVWELESSPRALWPHVSNTERVNRAVGLSAIAYSTETAEAGDVKRMGQVSKLGLTVAYQENPFEWIEARRMGVLREMTQGPFRWLVSITELASRLGGGTNLMHRVLIEPHGLFGRTLAAIEIGVKARQGFDRVYRRIDAALTGKLGRPGLVDPFEEPAGLSRGQQRRLDGVLERLGQRGVGAALVERLGEFLAHAPPQEVARIRPLALARRFGLPAEQVVTACLHAARDGLLVLLWDLLCPVCRIPSEVRETLRELREHGHCEACNLDFELDFARSVEMIFRAHPEVREVELGTFCVGGPAHSPHVAAQVRLGAGERVELDLALAEGRYRLRGPQLPAALEFRVQGGATASRWDIRLAPGAMAPVDHTLRPGVQALVMTNAYDRELLVRVERTADRDDALTAARAASLALFRALYPGEVLSPGQLVSVATVTLLVTELDRPDELYASRGDARAFEALHELFRLLEERVRAAGGAVVKVLGDGALAAFAEAEAAVDVALGLEAMLARNDATRDLHLRSAVHRGPAMAATLNDRLDYFGSAVRLALQLPALAAGSEVILTEAVAADPRVASLLRSRRLEGVPFRVDLPQQAPAVLLRLCNHEANARGRP